MRIIALDENQSDLRLLSDAIRKAVVKAEVMEFQDADSAISYAKKYKVDAVCLDSKFKGRYGADVVRMMQINNPRINAIFVTKDRAYAAEAFSVHASGFLEKPVRALALKSEFEDLRYFVTEKKKAKRIKARTFGTFDLVVDGKSVSFQRNLGKEVLAFLIDKRGGSVSRMELSELLFGDEEYSRKTQDYLSKIIKSLVNSLEAVDAGALLVRNHNAYAVDVSLLDCDAYDFLDGDPVAVNSFFGEYMSQFVWGEDYSDKFYKD